MVMSSERVAPARKGRMVSGASVWPMKMLAATLVDSAPRGAHGALHDPGDDPDDLLHETDVVEDGEEGGDEDDGGKDGEGEDGERVAGGAEAAEDQRGAVGGVAEEAGDDGGDAACRMRLAEGPLDDEEGEDDLEAEAPGYGAPADGAAVGGEGVGEREEDDESEKSGESRQREALLRISG